MITLVTGFWDIGRTWRPPRTYLRLFQELHKAVPFPMVIYVDPEFSEDVSSIVRGSTVPRKVVSISRAELPFAKGRQKYEMLQPMKNASAIKDTVDFALVTWAKTSLVARSARENPFSSEHFGWIDFGIAHVCDPAAVDWSELLKSIPDRFKICEMRATAPSEIEDLPRYYSYNRGKIASALFTGNRDSVIDLSDLFHEEVDRMCQSGFIVLEEEIFGALVARYPEKFERWFSDYSYMLANYSGIRGDVLTILENLKYSRAEGLSKNGTEITRNLLSAMKQKKIRLVPEYSVRLLFEGFICSYYADRELATDLARIASCLYVYSQGTMRPLLEKYNPRLQSNLGFVGISLDRAALKWDEFSTRPDFHIWLPSL